MDNKSKKDLQSRILAAQQRRNNLGLTVAQLNQMAGKVTPPPTTAFRGPVPKRVVRSDLSRKMKRPQLREAPFRKDGIFLSGGIGDIFAVESFMPTEARNALSAIYYGTQKSREIIELWGALPNYPNLKKHRVIWEDFSKFWCFYSMGECVRKIMDAHMPLPMNVRRVQDYGIFTIFEKAKAGMLQYNGSSFLEHKLAEVDRFGLPEQYVCVSPFSSDKRLRTRDFDEGDWAETARMLRECGVRGVVLNRGPEAVPAAPEFIDLTNRTTILEAVEILKGACGYVGIDSFLSVLAAKLFNHPQLVIKSNNDHCYQNLQCYFAPQTDYRFVVRKIQFPPDISQRMGFIQNTTTKEPSDGSNH